MDNALVWADHHGIFMMFCAYVFATVMSSAPKDTPKTWGFWQTWCFNAGQALGASAGKYANTNPLLQKLTDTKVEDAGGGKTLLTTTSVTPIPAPSVVAPITTPSSSLWPLSSSSAPPPV
jgi:hypothetical protein